MFVYEEEFSKTVLLKKVIFETYKINWELLQTPLRNEPDLVSGFFK